MKKLTMLLMSLLLISCSSGMKKEVAEDARKMTPHMSKPEMVNKMKVMLERIPGLSKYQQERLVDLHAEVWAESLEINQEVRKHKVLLFKYLAENKSNKQINYVKNKVKKLYLKKLDLMLGSFAKAKIILGKNARKILMHHDFMLYHGISNERF